MMVYTVLDNKAEEQNTKPKEHTLFSSFFRGISMKDFRERREGERERVRTEEGH